MEDQLQEIFAFIHNRLSVLDTKREQILIASREIIRNCSVTIKHIHRKDIKLAEELASKVRESLKELEKIRDPSLNVDNNVLTAYQEYVEAIQFLHFSLSKPFMKPQEDEQIPILAYLHGMADLVGELRRYCLDKLKDSSTFSDAERSMNCMEDVYDSLLSLDFPSGLIVGVRKKTDIARNIVEKTRGDLVLAYNRGKIEEKIDSLLKTIKEDEGK
ncbi:MAG: hypothetical protein HeimC3_00850 [Candidatus Heimdallarchaeota archaeon LC_3]|nr:MAG: hypothetical protein HeimC3_00850 [Candidatus Heimdallarchaeota archaeon LC_3]